MNLKADIKKPASFGGLCVTASRRALTHHSMNDANNQRNTDVEAVHGHPSITWSDFWPAFLVVGLCSFASIPVTLRLPRGAGAEISRGGRG